MSEALPKRVEGPFSFRAKLIIIVVASLSLAGGFALAIFGEDMSSPPSSSNSAYSRSAIGHEVATELLEKLGIPVVISRYDSGVKAQRALLLLAEPEFDSGNQDSARDMAEAAKNTLVILPKRNGIRSVQNAAWVEDTYFVEEDLVSSTLHAFAPRASLVRKSTAESPSWVSEEGFASPTLADLQLMRSEEMTPLISTAEGDVLLGRIYPGNVYVLSDPDVIANHGIGQGDNAMLFAQIVNHIREEGDSVVIDEVIHGYRSKPSIWRSLFEFPLLLVSLQAFLITGILLWAMTRRFGKPTPSGGAIAPGKEFLIANTADLLHFGGYSDEMLARYLKDTVRHVRSRLHTPQAFGDTEAREWLDRVSTVRGASDSLTELEASTAQVVAAGRRHPRRVTHAARRIYKWKEEMLHGPAKRTKN